MSAQALLSSSLAASGRCASIPPSAPPSSTRPRIASSRQQMPPAAGYSGQCGPTYGGMFGWPAGPAFSGGANMSDVMNKPLSEVLRQLEQEFNAAAQQARQRQHGNVGANGQPGSSGSSSAMRLPVDSIEDAEAYWFFADLPGLEKKDVQIRVNQQARTVTLEGERVQPLMGEDNAKQKRNMQRRFGKFSHTLQLAEDADSKLITAKVHQGVLRLRVPKVVKPEPEIQTVPID